MTTHPSPEDPPTDVYLRTALRHAPDHSLTPPSDISQAILAAARQVHRPVRPPVEPAVVRVPVPRQRSWRDALNMVLSPRWAGGFAAGLVAALVLGLWIDNDLPEPVARQAETGSVTIARNQAPSVDATPAPTSSGSVATPPSPSPPPPATPAAARKPSPRATPSTTTATPAQPTLQKAPTLDESTARTAATAAPPTSTAEAMVDSRRSNGAARDTTADSGQARASMASKAPQGAGKAEAAAGALRSKLAASQGTIGLPAAVAPAPSAASPALTLLRRATAESNARTAIWTWQMPGSNSPRSFDADGQAWLLRVVQTARGRWVDVAEPSDGADAAEVRWWRDDQLHARLRIEVQGLRWLEPSGRVRLAPLDPAALERLRQF